MSKMIKLFAASALIASLSSVSAFAAESALNGKTEKPEVNAENNDKCRIYLGFEGGTSIPAAKGFTHKDSNTKVTLKKSPLYTGLIGYEFSPGMFLELSVSRQPKFNLGINLPDNKGTGKTKASADVYMLNLVYDLMDIGGITPYVVLGAGMANVNVKEVNIDHPLYPIVSMNTTKKSSKTLAWQAGLGAAYKVTDNFRLIASAKLQVINNVKLRYSSFNPATNKTDSRGTMKKTLGTGEFVVGFTYALPF
jgi:opacity protein-like surface antigen